MLIAETGEGLQNANSYCLEDEFDTYCDDRGYTVAAGDAEAALIRATTFIDTYRYRFPGYRTKRRLQGLEWPRVGAYTTLSGDGREYPYPMSHRSSDYQQYLGVSYIAANVVPVEIIAATIEAALRELAAPGSMQPDLERGGMISRLKAGSVEIDYQPGANPQSTTQLIDGLLAGLLLPPQGLFATSSRG